MSADSFEHGHSESLPATFTFAVSPVGEERLQVISFTGREAVSELFAFDVVLSASHQEALVWSPEHELLGVPARLTMHVPGDPPRVVRGVIAAFERVGEIRETDRVRLHVRVVPSLWLHTQTRRSRIFQELTVQQIVDIVLGEWHLPHRWDLATPLAPRTYCTQYQESDYDFIRRLLAEEGIFFFFEPPAGGDGLAGAAGGVLGAALGAATAVVGGVAGMAELASVLGPAETLVMADHERSYPPLPTEGVARFAAVAAEGRRREAPRPALAVRPAAGVTTQQGYVAGFTLGRELRPKTALLGDYDFRHPDLLLLAQANVLGEGAQGLATTALTSAATRAAAAVGWSTDGRRAPPGDPPAELPPGKLRVYEHHDRVEHESVPGKHEVDPARARMTLEQLRRDATVGHGESWCPQLVAGHTFRLQDHSLSMLDRDYVVTAVEHRGVRTDT